MPIESNNDETDSPVIGVPTAGFIFLRIVKWLIIIAFIFAVCVAIKGCVFAYVVEALTKQIP